MLRFSICSKEHMKTTATAMELELAVIIRFSPGSEPEFLAWSYAKH